MAKAVVVHTQTLSLRHASLFCMGFASDRALTGIQTPNGSHRARLPMGCTGPSVAAVSTTPSLSS